MACLYWDRAPGKSEDLNNWFPRSLEVSESSRFLEGERRERSGRKESRHTSNWRVALAGIEGGEPEEPYA